jgi:hypothetical protein
LTVGENSKQQHLRPSPPIGGKGVEVMKFLQQPVANPAMNLVGYWRELQTATSKTFTPYRGQGGRSNKKASQCCKAFVVGKKRIL